MAVPERIYKIVSAEVMAEARRTGHFAGMPIDRADGYLHFSTADQLAETLRLHFRGQRDLVVFAVPTAPLGAALRFEPSRGGQLFPHLYGVLDLALAEEETVLSVGEDGSVTLPEWVR